jgi:hypothetical protein
MALTLEQQERLVEIVRTTGGIARRGFIKASEEFGQSVAVMRNAWYNKNLSSKLRQKNRMLVEQHYGKVEQMTLDLRVEQVKDNTDLSDVSQLFDSVFNNYTAIKNKLDEVMEENKTLKEKCVKMENDYSELMTIINKARVLYVNESVIEPTPQKFKMERNGELNREHKDKTYI